MPLPPSTRSVRVHTADALEAMALTGLEEGPAVRKQPVTLKDHAEAAIGHIRRLVEEAK